MTELGIDIETYSSNDLSSCGVYKYAEAKDFTILLFSYSIDGGKVQCCDFALGEALPDDVYAALTDADVTKTAFNAAFERICLSRYYNLQLDPAQWKCTMIRAARMGLPLSLKACGEALHLTEQKMDEGKTLIRFFSVPIKHRAGKDLFRDSTSRHLPADYPEKWVVFKSYNIRDVEVEQAILKKVRRLESPRFDDNLYVVDQHINDRGVMIDRQLVENAKRFDEQYKAELLKEAQTLTGLENPNSPAQIKKFIEQMAGQPIFTLNKKSLDELEEKLIYYPTAQRVIALRREMGKTSNKKYSAMLDCVCEDGRVHGLLQFYGAARTGRWAGRLVQLQNLPQNHLEDLDYARRLVKAGDLEDFEMNYSNVTQVLSELIRTAFVAKDGCTFHVCDFSAIECRVIAWLAGENWVLDVFRQGGDIYCATASKMFKKPVEKHGQNSELRQKGKIATLALGYGGGVSALEAMGGKHLGLTEDEEKETVRLWRESNPHITALWKTVERAAMAAIKTGGSVTINRGIKVERRWGMLIITLPSGRPICYPRACIGIEEDGWREDKETIEYEGLNQTTKKWEKVRTYGGKLTENIVQAIARDILGTVILRAEKRGLDIVFHIHDEIIVEAKQGQTLAEVEELFSRPISWCEGLPLRGAGYTTPYYLKD
jgi:DNA polymerase